MTENQYGGASITGSDFSSPEFRAAVRAGGVTLEQATVNLQAAAEHFDMPGFEEMLAAHRPKVWKKINKRPSRLASLLRRWRP